MPETVMLSLPCGVKAEITPHGAAIRRLEVPDRIGRLDDILLAPEDAAPERRGFFGTTIGRYANRIADAGFTLDGQTCQLSANDGPHCLHGGATGFDLAQWRIDAMDHRFIALSHDSPDGDQGFPGRLRAHVAYRLIAGNDPALTGFADRTVTAALAITMSAETDRASPVSLTNHAFFNLGGTSRPHALRAIDDHRLEIAASHYLPTDTRAIPLPGPPQPVAGTAFDFRRPCTVGNGLRSGHPQLLAARGYDHCFCMDDYDGTLRLAARLADPLSGRQLTIWSNQPGLQLYSGNFLDGSSRGKGGAAYRMGDGLCLEPGAWPDAPNRPDFPAAILRPGEVWSHRMLWLF